MNSCHCCGQGGSWRQQMLMKADEGGLFVWVLWVVWLVWVSAYLSKSDLWWARFCVAATFGVILWQQLFGRRVIKRGEQPAPSCSKLTFSKKFADFEKTAHTLFGPMWDKYIHPSPFILSIGQCPMWYLASCVPILTNTISRLSILICQWRLAKFPGCAAHEMSRMSFPPHPPTHLADFHPLQLISDNRFNI